VDHMNDMGEVAKSKRCLLICYLLELFMDFEARRHRLFSETVRRGYGRTIQCVLFSVFSIYGLHLLLRLYP